jgi:ABC-type glycerol-3-phosphate transport system substrate-binding protein
MKRMLSLAIVLGGMSLGVVGCSSETSTTKETEVSGPGGTTTVTEEKTVETTGENPPPAK